MTERELEQLPRPELVKRALAVGIVDPYAMPNPALAREVLVRVGEVATQQAWDAAFMYGRLREVELALAGLRADFGASLRAVEDVAARGLHLAEASLLSTTFRRTPTPTEVGGMTDRALQHLAEGLGIQSGRGHGRRPRAVLMDEIAERMGWDTWKRRDDEDDEGP